MSKILSRGDSASVSLIKEIREATEGKVIHIDANLSLKESVEKEIQELFDLDSENHNNE